MTKQITLTLLLGLFYSLSFGQNQKITISVTVPNKTDKVYITGNQNELGDWQPDKILMKSKSKYERYIEFTPSNYPIEFKFTKGNWDNEAFVSRHNVNNIKINNPIEKSRFSILYFEGDKITNFTKKYRKMYDGKVIVDIPEVFELVNIIMALHKDAEKEQNLYDISTDYYKKIKKHFTPFLQHPIMDTIHKNMGGLRYLKEHNINIFSDESYAFYGNLRANSCNYSFDNNQIKHNGYIKYHTLNYDYEGVSSYLSLLKDFAEKTNFRNFYKENKSYYDELIQNYKELNPIDKMNNWLEHKFGLSYNSYVVYFSPLTYGFHQTQNYEEDSFKQAFMFIARAMPDNKQSIKMNEIRDSRVVFTEIDHNFVNPLSDKYLDKIDPIFSNREKWAKEEIGGYNNAYSVFNEYMTWAVYSLYVYDNFKSEELEMFLPDMEQQMNQRGFNRFESFNRTLLNKYKTNPMIKITELYDYILEWAGKENN